MNDDGDGVTCVGDDHLVQGIGDWDCGLQSLGAWVLCQNSEARGFR
jgi:hypothetical protein